jgi:cbb3-type cytochrome oxidase maturation protein
LSSFSLWLKNNFGTSKEAGCSLHKLKSKTMGIIFLLIGVSLVVAIVFLGAFLWNVKSGQYDDNYTPSVRMLFDDGVKKVKNDDLQKTN